MMTKEEVAQVVAYCDENEISYKQLYWLRKKVFGEMSEKHLPVNPSVPIQATLSDEPLTEEEREEQRRLSQSDLSFRSGRGDFLGIY